MILSGLNARYPRVLLDGGICEGEWPAGLLLNQTLRRSIPGVLMSARA